MKKQYIKKVAVIAISLVTLGVGYGETNTSAATKSIKAPVKVEVRKKVKVRKPRKTTHYCTEKLKRKHTYVGPGYAGMFPRTKKWKSSNSKIATVAVKGDRDGYHKVTFKKKGKVTISCVVDQTIGNWVKGDTYKWIMTIK